MKPLCELCGEPLPDGEGMIRLHGYSGPCPKPPMPKNPEKEAAYKDLRIAALEADLAAKEAECERLRVDVERLDYLDHHGRDVVFGIGYGDSADAWCVRTASIGFVKCANLRVAIDAGRKEGAK